MTLLELFSLMRKHLGVVIALPIIFALVAAAVCWGVMADKYTAETSLYVLTKSQSPEQGITSTDLSASQMLTNDVAALIKSARVENEAAAAIDMEDLSAYGVKVDSSTTTRVINVSVTGDSPANVAIVANQLAATSDDIAQEVMDVQSINVIDRASEPTSPSGPPRLMYTLVALLAGLFVAIAFIVIADMANTRIRSAEEAAELLDLNIIGRIPTIKV